MGVRDDDPGAVCDVLAASGRDDLIPNAVGYSRGLADTRAVADMAAETEDDPYTQAVAADVLTGALTVADLALAARILDRYLDLVRAAGRDY